jgi:hypothetical protein
MTQRPFVNLNDAELMPQTPQKPEAGFEARFAPIAAPLGTTKLGCRLTVVPPGKKAFPHHVHHVNDELFVILTVRAPCALAPSSTGWVWAMSSSARRAAPRRRIS